MTPKYPLSSLESLREREVETRTRELAEAQLAAQRAEARAAEAKGQRERFEATTEAERTEMQARLESGAARVADMAHATAWRQRRTDERAAHAGREDVATGNAKSKRSEVQTAQRDLGEARARAKAVKRHHDQWREAKQRKTEAAEEEAAEDVWAATRPKRGEPC